MNSIEIIKDAIKYHRHGDALFWAYLSPSQRPIDTPWDKAARERRQTAFESGEIEYEYDFDDECAEFEDLL